jgi:hypothetical protein
LVKGHDKRLFLEGICKLMDRWTMCVAKQGTVWKNKTQTISISTLVKKVITKKCCYLMTHLCTLHVNPEKTPCYGDMRPIQQGHMVYHSI